MKSYEAEKKLVYRGLVLLAVVTVIEVLFSLFGKGYLGWKEAYYITWVHYATGFVIIILSLYKAYYIVAVFMHLAMETKTLVRTILIPLVLLVFAIGIFLYEGVHWGNNRSYVLKQDLLESERIVPEIPQDIKVEEYEGIH